MSMTVGLRALLVVGFVGASSVAVAQDRDAGWTRAPQGPFTAPAGELCPFTMSGVSLVDEVVFKTIATFPDGSPKEQIYKGALVVRFTNDDTGAYVDRDLGSSALLSVGADGSQNWTVIGPAAWGFFAGDNIPPGMYVK